MVGWSDGHAEAEAAERAIVAASRPLTVGAAVQVRVIPEGEPYDGPILGTVALTALPEHVDEARRVISEALRGKVGYAG